MNRSKALQLTYHSTVIAELEIVDSDQPWIDCEFTSLETFSEHRDFFYDYQKTYSSGTVMDWDEFFNQLSNFGYRLSNQHYEIKRFILILSDSECKARVRGKRVKST
ncbi:hypothetical protein [Pseudoalteromonas luteoviolacea]|uniref:Uncharacterized protein n=1 Tax=Pseudoalteromonas luteoviolacea S4060-1 TaxID=1365257 RepID=A0A167PDG3_9GAMM|nr:hypothetical protein [Pseudoalteromonas luteoviolacea]KZN70398.1 hypothetical protein N478_00410 [Pseudoalteromonas luteoviolacea S4060-1]